MSKVSTTQFAELLLDITRNKTDKEAKVIFAGLVKILYKYKLISQIDSIIDKYSKLYNKENNITQATIFSKNKLSKENKELIAEKLKKLFKSKEVNIQNSVDQNLCGGIKVKVNDTVIDLTLDNKINQLKNYLIKYS